MDAEHKQQVIDALRNLNRKIDEATVRYAKRLEEKGYTTEPVTPEGLSFVYQLEMFKDLVETVNDIGIAIVEDGSPSKQSEQAN